MSSSFRPNFSAMSTRLEGGDSPVWAVHDEALVRQAAGEDIYLLSVGDPDLATLPATVRAAIDSLEKGRTHYAPGRGELGLRQIIADIELRASEKPCDPDEVVIYPGATNAIYSVLACLLDIGDDIVVMEPMYVGYDGIFRALALNKIGVPLDVDSGFAFDLASVKEAITDSTRLVFINTPGNPAGNIIPAAALQDLAAYCLDRNIWLVCDEVYSMITFEGEHVSLRKAAQSLDNVIIVDGMSKSHAMTGWRLGWTVAPKDVADRLLAFTSSTIFGCCQFVQDAASHALVNDEEYINGVREEYRQRRNYVCERVRDIQGLSCKVPEAGMFVMIHVDLTSTNGLEFAEQLLADQGVSVLPGVGFGECTSGYVRVSLAQPINILRPAFDRIEKFCAEKSPSA
ncbi:MAG: pyridoxal phosphate-dependent aminotransferase [Halioglobus sp.]